MPDTPETQLVPELPRGRTLLVNLILLSGDLLSLGLAFWIASQFRAALIPLMGGVVVWESFMPLLLQSLVIIAITYALTGLYPGFGYTAVEEMQKIFYSLTLGYGIIAVSVYFRQAGLDFPRSVFILGWPLACLFNMVMRFILRNRFSLTKWWGLPVLIVGPASEASEVIRKFQHSRRLGLRPVLVLDENPPEGLVTLEGIPLISVRAPIEALVKRQRIPYAVLIDLGDGRQAHQNETLRWLSETFPTVLIVLQNSPIGSLWVRTMDLEGRLTLKTTFHLLNRHAELAKRAFDLVFGLLLGLAAMPFYLAITLLIRLDSPGAAVFAQERLGRGGRCFHCYKFRTMSVDAEAALQKLLDTDPTARREYQKYHKLAHDPRITRMGSLLRKFSLDELPQIWNVLRGDLSLVGPRAYLPRELDDMRSDAGLILKTRPGLTGWWQVMGRHSTTFEQRLQLDVYYLSNWSLSLDIYIMIKTAWIILSGHGA